MRKIFLIFIPASGVIFYLLYLLCIPVLILEQEGRIIFLRRIKPGDNFSLGYLHSVAKTDVWEKFIINNEYQIVLAETMFQGQGAGLPYNLANNEIMIREGSWFKIAGMKRLVPVIHWRVDSQWQNRFRFNQEEAISTAALAKDGIIQIKISRVKLREWLNYRFFKNFGIKGK